MRLVVTGAAGFIGSHLCERLVADGHRVVGIDSFSRFYARERKQANLGRLRIEPAFSLDELDLRDADLSRLLRGADAVLHLAGRPGVRGTDARPYLDENVRATRALLSGCEDAGVRRLVLASSSSVYAPAPAATAEDAPLAPASAYARTKLACERLCAAARIEAVTVRYFTVYGPRQRPDMAFARFIDGALGMAAPAPLYGSGEQVRDFTYVGDAVEGTVRALERGRPGVIYNISGGSPVTLAMALRRLARVLGRPLVHARRPADPVDALRTHADLSRARDELGYRPAIGLEAGLRRQIEAAEEEAARRAVAEVLACGS